VRWNYPNRLSVFVLIEVIRHGLNWFAALCLAAPTVFEPDKCPSGKEVSFSRAFLNLLPLFEFPSVSILTN
jgi:hypothetical protein